jgi:hypothetical protein
VNDGHARIQDVQHHEVTRKAATELLPPRESADREVAPRQSSSHLAPATGKFVTISEMMSY